MDLAELLNYYDIDYQVEDYMLYPDITAANTESSKEYCIKLLSEDFERVNEIRNRHAIAELDQVNENHYLFEFTNEELLMEVIAKKDEWSSFDYELAKKNPERSGCGSNGKPNSSSKYGTDQRTFKT